MIKGIGIDLIELNRIDKAIKKNGRFLNRILTVNETAKYESLHKYNRKLEYLAGRFAAKEAFAKATGKGIGKLSFQHIEVLSDENGAPKIHVPGYDANKVYISITHSKEYAVAQVIITD